MRTKDNKYIIPFYSGEIIIRGGSMSFNAQLPAHIKLHAFSIIYRANRIPNFQWKTRDNFLCISNCQAIWIIPTQKDKTLKGVIAEFKEQYANDSKAIRQAILQQGKFELVGTTRQKIKEKITPKMAQTNKNFVSEKSGVIEGDNSSLASNAFMTELLETIEQQLTQKFPPTELVQCIQ